MSVRICLQILDEIFRAENGRATGIAAVVVDLGFEWYRGLNNTSVRERTIGALVDREKLIYDGCIGSMQRNESDSIFMPLVTIPIMGPNLTHTNVIGFEKMAIFSCYEKPDGSQGKLTQVMDMVFSFDWSLWLVIFMFYSVLLMFLAFALKEMRHETSNKVTKLMQRMKHQGLVDVVGWFFEQQRKMRRWEKREKKKKIRQPNMRDSVLVTIACILKQHSSCSFGGVKFPPVSILYMMMTLLAFYCGFYLTSMIKTEMVVFRPPFTVNNYKEIIASGRRPTFVRALNADYAEFASAAPGTNEKKIWDIVMRMGLNESLIDVTPEDIVKHGIRACELKEVLLIRARYAERPFFTKACQFSRTQNIMTNMNGWLTHDPSARELLRGDVHNHRLEKSTSRLIQRRKQLTFEADLVEAALRFAGDFFPADDKFYSSIAECYSNVIVMPHIDMRAAEIFHYASLFTLTGSLLFLALMILILE